MSTRSEYEAAKRAYHTKGRALMNSHGSARGEARKAYEAAKRAYHTAGRKLAKKGR